MKKLALILAVALLGGCSTPMTRDKWRGMSDEQKLDSLNRARWSQLEFEINNIPRR